MKGKDIRNKQKAEFYFREKLKCHVKLIDRNFLNGFFDSELLILNGDEFYWFIDDVNDKQRLFLNEIFDIQDHREKRQ